MPQDYDHNDLLEVIKDKLLRKNEIGKATRLIEEYTEFYPKVLGKVSSDEFDRQMLNFIISKAKKYKIKL
ncbi:MAG: hypothetical protein RBU23_09600 [Candidatus Auribacterota bacterium]|jgi:hypothetical protein|nr:hypothetical protein [Candidatus Auribacterota bacterium]